MTLATAAEEAIATAAMAEATAAAEGTAPTAAAESTPKDFSPPPTSEKQGGRESSPPLKRTKSRPSSSGTVAAVVPKRASRHMAGFCGTSLQRSPPKAANRVVTDQIGAGEDSAGNLKDGCGLREVSPRPPPTSDQLNDPVFRGMMKARAKAMQAAKATKAAGAAGGLDDGLDVEGRGGGRSAEGGPAGAMDSGHGGDLRARFAAGMNTAAAANAKGTCRVSPRKGGLQRGQQDGDERRSSREWMSSRRSDWALDDVFVGPKSGKPSSLPRQLIRSRSASAAPSTAPPPQSLPRPRVARPRRARAKPKTKSTDTDKTGGSSKLPAGHSGARAVAHGAGMGAETGSAFLRGGDDASIGNIGAPQQQTAGVGPRSNANRKRRGGSEIPGEEGSAFRRCGKQRAARESSELEETEDDLADALSTAAAAAAAEAAADVQSRSSSSSREPQTTAIVRFLPQHKDASEAQGERAAPENRHKRSRETSAEARRTPAGSGAAPTAVPSPKAKRQQRQHRGGARGRNMVRKASAQAELAGQGAAAAAAIASTSAARRRAPDGKNVVFAGLCFVLVGLPENTTREVEGVIIAGGGRVLENIPFPSSVSVSSATLGSAPSSGAVAGNPSDASARSAGSSSAATAPARRLKKTKGAENAEEVVVVVSLPAASRREEYVLAIATGIPLVHHFWVSDSAEKGRALPAASYLLPGVRETSRRRQMAAGGGGGGGGGGASGSRAADGGGEGKQGLSAAAATDAAAAAAAKARYALTKAVTRPGTPLIGMTIAVAHSSPKTCERWARILIAAGAQAVRQISGDLLGRGKGEEEEDVGTVARVNSTVSGTRSRSTSKSDTVRSRGVGLQAPEKRGHCDGGGGDGCGGGGGGGGSLLQKALAGIDCVLCDYPFAWVTGDSTDCPPPRGENAESMDAGGAASGTGTVLRSGSAWPPVSLGRVIPSRRISNPGSRCRGAQSGGTTPSPLAIAKTFLAPPSYCGVSPSHGGVAREKAGEMMASLWRVVKAARCEGVPVVSLSWAVDCVVRGTRVKQQSRPEYLSPFLEESRGAGGRPRGGTAVLPQTTSLAVDGASSGGAGGSAHGTSSPLPAAMLGARTSQSRVLVFTSRAGDRYEVDDFVHFSAEEGTSFRRVANSSANSTTNTTSRSDWGVGRIVCLEQAGNGRVSATLEPLRRTTQSAIIAVPTSASAVAESRGGIFHLGVGGVTTHPSAESSVSRGRARRAKELKKVAKGVVSRLKVEASCLRGRVTIFASREFDARRGFCGRDPDVYARRGPPRVTR